MKQTTLQNYEFSLPNSHIDWELIAKEIKRSKQVRINWKNILGMTLTKYIALCKANGLSQELIYKEIMLIYDLSQEEARKLKIGIGARFAENATMESAKNDK